MASFTNSIHQFITTMNHNSPWQLSSSDHHHPRLCLILSHPYLPRATTTTLPFLIAAAAFLHITSTTQPWQSHAIVIPPNHHGSFTQNMQSHRNNSFKKTLKITMEVLCSSPATHLEPVLSSKPGRQSSITNSNSGRA
jgi:hypothetical protein